MSKKPTNTRGRRYSNAQKAEIIDFVAKVNTEKGRGGQLAAHKKYGLSHLTLKNWIRDGVDSATGASDALGNTLIKMRALAVRQEKLQSEMDVVAREFERLKLTL